MSCIVMLPSSVNTSVNPGGLPNLSKASLGMWHRPVLVWALGTWPTPYSSVQTLDDDHISAYAIHQMWCGYVSDTESPF